MNLLNKWKTNIQEVKWKTVNHNKHEFSNTFLDKKIKTLTTFFHKSDLELEANPNKELSTDPSNIWIIHLLNQKNLGSFELVLSICEVIDFYNQKNTHYLKSKLLQKNGRINKKSFRNNFFEVWLNYRLFQMGIEVQLDKCYRNLKNLNDEGFDSKFEFKGTEYIIECTKLKSWKEELLALTYKMLGTLYKRHNKFSTRLHFKPFYIYAIPTTEYSLGNKEFDQHLNNYFIEKINKETELYTSSSKAFKEIIIFSENEKLIQKYDRKYHSNNSLIKISSKFRNILMLDKSGKITYNTNEEYSSQKINFKVSASCKAVKSPKDFEDFLIGKIKKKLDQHKNRKNQKLIIAVELEKFVGLNSFPIESVETFKKLKKRINENLSILIFYKNSNGEKLIIKSQVLYSNNEEFMKFMIKNRIII